MKKNEDENLQNSKNFEDKIFTQQNNYTKFSNPREYQKMHSGYNMPELKSQAITNIIDFNNYHQHKQFEFTDTEIKEAFDAIDINHNQYITHDELSLFLEILQIPATQEEINEMIRMADLGNTNSVNFNQFKQIMKGESLSPIGVAFPPTYRMLQQQNNTEEQQIQFQNLALQNQYQTNQRFSKRRFTSTNNDIVKQSMVYNLQDNSSDVEQIKQSIENLDIDKKQFQYYFKKLKENTEKNAKNTKNIQEFFEIEEKEVAKNIYQIFKNQQNEVEFRQIIIFWIANQNYDCKNKAFLSFYVIDTEDSGMIKFSEKLQ